MSAIYLGQQWFNKNNHPPKDKTTDINVSDEVLMDLTGERKVFRVGWYSFADRRWMTHDDNHGYALTGPASRHIKWTHLPLVKYDI